MIEGEERRGETFEGPANEEEADVAVSVYLLRSCRRRCFEEQYDYFVAQENQETYKEMAPLAGKSVLITLESLRYKVDLAETTGILSHLIVCLMNKKQKCPCPACCCWLLKRSVPQVFWP